MDKISLWEILVPCVRNNGKPFRLRYHRLWDKQIRSIAGGLTILKPTKGQWEVNGTVYAERMIPVRIACTEEQIRKIIDITMTWYDQLAIMVYRVSDYVIIAERNEKHNIPIKYNP